MKKVRYKYRDCGYEGAVEILTKDEMHDPHIPRRPVRCPHCGSGDVDAG